MKSSFEVAFPNTTRWVKEVGTIEIGYDPRTDSFVRAIDEGGMRWSGQSRYETVDEALQDLEDGIKTTLSAHEPSAKRRASSRQSRTTKMPDQLTRKPSNERLPKQLQKLEEIVEAIRRKERVQVTRLTVVKKLCENPDAAVAFALFLARKSQARLREKQGQQRYRDLINRALRAMKTDPEDPSDDRKSRLRSLLRQIEEEQNEYESIRWTMVRNIKSWDLLVVENTLRSILRTAEAPHWIYQATRYHVGSSMFLVKESIPKIEEIAQFWRRYFKLRAQG